MEISEAKKALLENITNLKSQLSLSELSDKKNAFLVKSLNSEMKSKTENNLKLKETLDNLNVQLEKSKSEYTNLKDSIPIKINEVRIPLSKELAAEKQSKEKIIEELNNKDKLLSDLKEINTDLKSELNISKMNNTDLTEKFSGINTDLKNENTRLSNRLEEQKSNYGTSISFLEKNLLEAEGLIIKNDQEISRLASDNSSKDKTIAELNKVKAQIPQEIKKAESPLQAIISNLEKKAETLQNTININVSERTSLEKAFKSSKEDLVIEQVKSGKLAEDLKQLSQKSSDYKNELPKLLEQEKQPLLSKISEFEQTIAKITAESKDKANTLSQLSSKNSELNNSLKAYIKKSDDYKEEIKGLTNKLQEEVSSIPEKIKNATFPLDNTIVDLKDELKTYKTQLKEKDVLITSISSDVESKNKLITSLNSKADDLQTIVAELKEKLQSTENKIPELTKQAQLPLLNKIAALQDSLNKYDAENAIKSKLINDISIEKASLSKANKSLNDKSKMFKQEINDLSNKIQSMVSVEPQKIASIKAPLEKIIDQLKISLQENDTLIKEKEITITELTKSEEDIGSDLLLTKQKVEAMSSSIGELNARIAALLKDEPIKIENATKPLLAKISSMQSNIELSNKSINDKDKQIKELLSSNNDLTKRMSSLENQILELKGLLEKREKEADLNVKLLKENELLLSNLKKDNASKSSDLLLTQRKAQDFAETIDKLSSKFSTLEGSIPDKIQQAKNPIIEKLKDVETRLKSSFDLNEKYSMDINTLETKNKELIAQLSFSNKKISSLDKELSDLSNKLTSERSSISTKIDNAKLPLEKTIVSSKEELNRKDALLQQKDSIIEELKKGSGSLNQELLSSKKEIQNHLTTISDLNEQISNIQASVPSKIEQAKIPLLDKITEHTRTINALIEQNKDHVANIKESSSSKNALSGELNVLKTKNDKYKEEVTDLTNKLLENKSSLSDKIQSAKLPLIKSIEDLKSKTEELSISLKER
ncbi:MAG: hypothetical protein KKD07_09855, partial [Candidatus Omnitrophica bacterium]|nr:hypothetical protein [Candidatus Omnitrophota bacterium]